MSRIPRTWFLLLVAIVAAVLAATSSSSAASAKTVKGTVGPGFTIGLTMHGKRVTKLKAGRPTASSSATARAFTTSI